MVATTLAQTSATQERAYIGSQITTKQKQKQATRQMKTKLGAMGTGAAIGGALFGVPGAIVGGGIGGILESTILNPKMQAQEDREMAAVQARHGRANQLAGIRKQEGAARHMGGIEVDRGQAASLGFAPGEAAGMAESMGRQMGFRDPTMDFNKSMRAVRAGADPGMLGQMRGLSAPGGAVHGTLNPEGLFGMAQAQGLQGAKANEFVQSIGGVATMRRSFGARSSGARLQSEAGGLAKGGLRGEAIGRVMQGFQRPALELRDEMFGGMAKSMGRAAAYRSATKGGVGSMEEMYERLGSVSQTDMAEQLQSMGGSSGMGGIAAAQLGRVSLTEGKQALAARPGSFGGGPQIQGGLEGVIAQAQGQMELLNEISTESMVNLIKATNNLAKVEEDLAKKIEDLAL
jgi:hypothetical protein